MTNRVRLVGVAAALPPQVRTSEEVEEILSTRNAGWRLRPGLVQTISGIRSRRVAADGVQCSDLAAEAGRRVLAGTGVAPGEVDLLVFAAASQDLLEPATANIVQEKVGTRCQVFDVKNACNSFLNGVQLAESLILSGSCRTALVTTGEICSRAVAWQLSGEADFKRHFPGFTMGDAGAAVLLAGCTSGRGIFYRRFTSISRHWELATIPCGGSMHPRGEEFTYLRGDGTSLKQRFIELGPPLFCRMMQEAGVGYDDFKRIFVHQVTVPYVREMLRATGMPSHKVEHTVGEFGNMASASIPVALARAIERGAVAAGDRIMCVGMASGISIGVIMIDL
jgi:3-oxoacyl-[acyl-carrier-protein] synthase-3